MSLREEIRQRRNFYSAKMNVPRENMLQQPSGWAPKVDKNGMVRARCHGVAARLPPSPPAEKAAARQDQAGEASTGDGAGNAGGAPI